jgi:rifampicin phosphotransferase
MLIIPLEKLAAIDILMAGGKGANLGVMIRAGLPVPDGFVVTTEAYLRFVEQNHMEGKIRHILDSLAADDPLALENTSEKIRVLFAGSQPAADISASVLEAYRALGAPAVAVRSSATAEDLPDLSFAGQQDTFLNITGEDSLLRALRDCWASLWTARALGYRARNGISAQGLALAVVIQRMVAGEFSGVLFTANPLTGSRREIVIDAVPGLGERLVSGQWEPDHYTVAWDGGGILDRRLRAREIVDGGEVRRMENRPHMEEETVRRLAALGRRTAGIMGGPQDIEWSVADGNLFLLQSRPITSLYPIPEPWMREPLRLMFSFGSVQGLLDPMTPIGQQTITHVLSGLAGILGFRLSPQSQTLLLLAGERPWINITSVFRHATGRRILYFFLPYVDPAAALALRPLAEDPHFLFAKKAFPCWCFFISSCTFPCSSRGWYATSFGRGKRCSAPSCTVKIL